jgi:hypothetical protein
MGWKPEERWIRVVVRSGPASQLTVAGNTPTVAGNTQIDSDSTLIDPLDSLAKSEYFELGRK